MPAYGDELRERTKRFAFEVIRLVEQLPRSLATDAIARQLIKSGTSVCANYRAAGRSRSKREFVARLAIALEEADETEFWLEALLACTLAGHARVEQCRREASELRAILYASLRTARSRLASS